MATLNLQVSSANNSSDQQSGQTGNGRNITNTGACTLGRGDFMPGSHALNDEWSGALYFPSVTIPQGATINSANLILTPFATWNPGGVKVIEYYVSAQANDNAGTLASTGANLTAANRPRSTATVAWVQTSVVVDVDQTVSITSVIQEIINRAGWVSGNAIVILIDTHELCTTGEYQEYNDYTSATTKAPKLQMDYTAGGAADPFPERWTYMQQAARWRG